LLIYYTINMITLKQLEKGYERIKKYQKEKDNLIRFRRSY